MVCNSSDWSNWLLGVHCLVWTSSDQMGITFAAPQENEKWGGIRTVSGQARFPTNEGSGGLCQTCFQGRTHVSCRWVSKQYFIHTLPQTGDRNLARGEGQSSWHFNGSLTFPYLCLELGFYMLFGLNHNTTARTLALRTERKNGFLLDTGAWIQKHANQAKPSQIAVGRWQSTLL